MPTARGAVAGVAVVVVAALVSFMVSMIASDAQPEVLSAGLPGHSYLEVAGSRAGVRVFGTPQGNAAPADVPATIPYGQTVWVQC